MFASERQRKIYELIQKSGAVTASNLIEMFNVSIETIRRDLLHMEQKGMLTRVHGGAVLKGDMMPFAVLEERNNMEYDKKLELCRKAVEFISDGDVIGIEFGSTASVLADVLRKSFSKLTVITNSVDVFNILKSKEGFNIIMIGGDYFKEENAFYGTLAVNSLSLLHIRKTFVFPSALSLDCGMFVYYDAFRQTTLQMMEVSDFIYVLADSSKFGKKDLRKLDDMQTNYTYITDSGLKYGLKKLYEENNIKIYIGGEEQ